MVVCVQTQKMHTTTKKEVERRRELFRPNFQSSRFIDLPESRSCYPLVALKATASSKG